MSKPPAPAQFDFDALPGHLIRRLQQIAVGIFLQETEAWNITPVQFAALQGVAAAPGVDQRTLARTIAFDTSTIGGVIDRLEARGLLTRYLAPEDRRLRRLALTAEGQALLQQVLPAMQRAQARMLAPLAGDEQAHFMSMLRTLVQANNSLSRAPGEA